MKRPGLALLLLLATLAMGLAAISPRRSEATTLGELFCAIEIVDVPRCDADNYFCPDCPYADECPRVCTPPGAPEAVDSHDTAPLEAVEIEPVAIDETDSQVELNAAVTSDVPDDDTAWEDEYGEYYGDFYSADEEYGDNYASEYEESPTAAEPTAESAAVAESAADDAVFRYGEDYDPWTPVIAEPESQPGPADLIVEPQAADDVGPAAAEPYDLYGRQVGDEYYGYDYEEAPPEASAYEDAYEYEYDYEYLDNGQQEAIDESPAATETADYESTAKSYYEEYFPDYYAELYGSDEFDAEPAAEAPDAVESNDDLTTEYDAAYDEAVYGERADATEPAPSAAEAGEVSGEEIIDELVDPAPTADAESDLPWADEVPAVEETAADRPVLESEYGSDYAEDYYRALFEEESLEASELEDAETAEPAFNESYDYFQCPYHAGECVHPRALAFNKLVANLGQQVFAWTESLELVSMRLHSACVQLAELPSLVDKR